MDPSSPRPAAARPARVAVLGATGVGRFHATWWCAEGAEPCAFLGSSPDSVRATGRRLAGLLCRPVRGYTSLDRLLAEAKPDVVDVCTPPALHDGHVRAALAAGCDVLCEKPYLYDANRSPAELLAAARELGGLASAAGRRLALCTQYAVAADTCRRLLLERGEEEPFASFHGLLASPRRRHPPDPAHVWVDLGPHLVGALQVLAPCPPAAWSLADAGSGAFRAWAVIEGPRADGTRWFARLEAARTGGPPDHVRRLAVNGASFDLAGETARDGHFGMRYVGGGSSRSLPDPLRLLIRAFLRGRAPLGAAEAADNLAWVFRVLERLAPGAAG